MRKKLLVLFAAGVMATSLLAGCSCSTKTTTNDDGTTSRYVAVKDAELNMMEGSGFFKLKEG